MMPTSTKPRKSKLCTFVIRGKFCGQPGTGNPVLCENHAVCEEEYDDGELDLNGYIDDAVDSIADNPRIRSVLDKAAGVFDKFAQIIDKASTPPPRIPRNQPPPPKHRAAPRPPPVALTPAEARTILGFASTQVLSVESIKKRKRDLAGFFHPDKGGSVESMQRVNTAADVLIASVK